MATIRGNGSKGHHYYEMDIWEVSGSGSSSTNKSAVTFNFRLGPIVNGYNWSSMRTMHYTITINGTNYTGDVPSTYDGRSVVTIVSDTTVEIEHNNDGTKNLDFSFSVVDNSSASYTSGSASASGSIGLETIPRYFSSTPTLSLKSKTETSITYNWSTSETCDSITWSGTGTKSTTGLPGTSGTVIFSDLTANTSYTHSGTFRRQDSGLSTASSNYTNSTDNYPYVSSLSPTVITLGQTAIQTVNIQNPHSRETTVYVRKNDINGELIGSATTTGNSAEITIPTNDLYQEIPSAQQGTLYYYCVYGNYTTDGITGIYRVNGNEKPTFPTSNWSYVADLTSLTNNNQKIIDGYSTVTITVDTPASSDYYATISNYYATWGNATPQTFDGTAPVSLVKGNGTSIVVLANDSRGLQSDLQASTLDVTANRILYNKPVVNTLETHRLNGIDTIVTLNATGTMFKDKFGEDGVQNAISSAVYYVKPVGSSTWSQAYGISLNDCYFDSTTGEWSIQNASIHQNGQSGGFPQGSSFNIKLELYDAQGLLGYGTAISTIEDGTLARDVYKDYDGEYHEGINGLADGDYTQTIHGNINVNGEYYKNGEPFEGGGGGGETLPIGTILEFPSTNSNLVPVGWMICDGRALSRTEYADLFAVIGTYFGAGDGQTTFNIPSKAGLVTVGYKSSDSDFDTIGKTGGVKSVTLTAAQSGLPKHSHGMDGAGGHDHSISGISSRQSGNWNGVVASANTSDRNWSTVSWVGDHTHRIHDAGPSNASEAHTNLQPYEVSNFIIKVTETTAITAQVINQYANNTRDAYSCEYINNHFLNHPVGSLYISTDPTSPASMFGGTWEQLDGYYLYLGNSYAKTSYTGKGTQGHTLTTSQIPSHRHWISSADYDDGNMTTTGSNSQYYGLFADAGSYSADDTNKAAGRYSAYTGSGGSHSHDIATLEVYAWRRTA